MVSPRGFLLALCLPLCLGACARWNPGWNNEAGAFLNRGELGSATRTNMTEMTCRKMSPVNVSKYGNPLASNCPGRKQDGKYALFAYGETISSATELPSEAIETDTTTMTLN